MGTPSTTIETLRAARNGLAVASGFFGVWIFDASSQESLAELGQASSALMIGAAVTQIAIRSLQLQQERA